MCKAKETLLFFNYYTSCLILLVKQHDVMHILQPLTLIMKTLMDTTRVFAVIDQVKVYIIIRESRCWYRICKRLLFNTVVFNLRFAAPRRVVNHFWKGSE